MDLSLIRRLGRFIIAGLLLSMATAAFFGWLAEEVLAGDTAAFDSAIRHSVHELASPILTDAMLAVTALGSPLVAGALVGVCAWLFWSHGRPQAAILVIVAAVGGSLLEGTLKEVFRRPRPVPYFGMPAPLSYSFPSGHAMFSASFYAALAIVLSAGIRARWARAAVWVAAFALILAIGFSRIYLGVHYPTDVIAGYAAAFIWVWFVAMGDRWQRRRPPGASP